MPATKKEAGVAQYEFEIAIAASADEVWNAIVNETDAWWLPDFHMVGQGSMVRLEPWAGGRLIEEHEDGGSLLWYTVQWIQPARRVLYLRGDIAPDWGGPATSCLKLLVEEAEGGAILRVSDAHHGFISDETLKSLESGWTQLFTEGLKRLVEGRGADG